MNILLLCCAVISAFSLSYGENEDDEMRKEQIGQPSPSYKIYEEIPRHNPPVRIIPGEPPEQIGQPSPSYKRYEEIPIHHPPMRIIPGQPPEPFPGRPSFIRFVPYGHKPHHPTVAQEEENKNKTLSSTPKLSTTEPSANAHSTNSSFDTQNLIVVDHNCGAGKLPDERGECQTME